MKTHLTNREIDNFVSGLASAKDAERAMKHIAACSSCSEITAVLSAQIAGEPLNVSPGDHVRESVISEWYRIHEGEAAKNYKVKPRFNRLIAGLAVAASAVIAVSTYFIISTVTVIEEYPLEVTAISGNAFVNSSALVINHKLLSGDFLRTGDDSSVSAVLPYYEFRLGRASSAEIVLNSTSDGILIKLHEGFIISKSAGFTDYRFVCGEYSVVPVGTEFMLGFSDGKFYAAVSQGKVVIADSGFKIEITAGKKWSSENRERLERLDKETELLLKSPSGGVWPSEAYLKNRGAIINGPVNRRLYGEEPVMKAADENNEESVNSVKELKEKQEKIRINRELREDMNSIKKEQRDGKRLRNRD
jgi:hypothetical protein